MQPAPLSETVDHTVEEEGGVEPPQKAFTNPSPPLSPSPSSLTLSSSSSSEGEESEDEDEDKNNRSELGLPIGGTHTTQAPQWLEYILCELCGWKFIV